ncbi:MAG: hypothetical protein HY690_08475 [Chloroflexi bacterium]|nr:hypothetical protein [Chloroflexota bacterium]
MKRRVEMRSGTADEYIVAKGVITDEPPSSSDGQPVFVSDRDGRVLGPQDAPMLRCSVHPLPQAGDQPGWNAAVDDWIRRGGWRLAFELAL